MLIGTKLKSQNKAEQMVELLAPAKDKICAKAAVDYGADAIYIGADEFSARKKAGNTLDDIKEIVDYAHKFNVKVYAAVNTILTDSELERAEILIKNLAEIEIDAVIIQDMGLINTLKLKNLCAHASTQCNIRTIEKVKFLESIGFSRVVLARELSLKEIKEIKKQTNVELEVFIHGALCVSYSGQCYLSYAIGKRSANRGECAQPCRKKYSLIDENGNYIAKDKYLLCLKDFNASKYLKELANSGVTSFKIEGRLKDVNYVKNVVGYYRKLIDKLNLGKTSSGKVYFDFEPDLDKSFNRGFCDYFLEKRKKCYSFETPKFRGEYIGKITKITKDYFEIKTDKLIVPQDGLCFLADELQGFLVNKVVKNKIYPNKMPDLKIGTEMYRNFDVQFEKILKNSKTQRKISVDIDFSLNKLLATDEDDNSTEISFSYDELAQNPQKMKLNIINQFKKSGESEFLAENIKICTDQIPFLPVSKLNELRRELFKNLTEQRKNNFKRGDFALRNRPEKIPEKSLQLDYRANILNQKAKSFYEDLGFEIKEKALESGINPKDKIVMDSKHCLKYAFDMCKTDKKLFLVDEKGKKYELKFNCKKCEMEIIY